MRLVSVLAAAQAAPIPDDARPTIVVVGMFYLLVVAARDPARL